MYVLSHCSRVERGACVSVVFKRTGVESYASLDNSFIHLPSTACAHEFVNHMLLIHSFLHSFETNSSPWVEHRPDFRLSFDRLLDTERVVLGEVFSEDALYADIEAACAQNDKLRERLTKRTQTLQVSLFVIDITVKSFTTAGLEGTLVYTEIFSVFNKMLRLRVIA